MLEVVLRNPNVPQPLVITVDDDGVVPSWYQEAGWEIDLNTDPTMALRERYAPAAPQPAEPVVPHFAVVLADDAEPAVVSPAAEGAVTDPVGDRATPDTAAPHTADRADGLVQTDTAQEQPETPAEPVNTDSAQPAPASTEGN